METQRIHADSRVTIDRYRAAAARMAGTIEAARARLSVAKRYAATSAA